ncbi:MAG: hypothetical protein V4563_14950 [Pseudomonadota bacterium]
MSDKIKIERGVPMPIPRGAGGKWLSLLSKMNVGDSFFAAGEFTAALSGKVSRARIKLGIKLAYRKENCGVRVWRTQ